MLRPGRRFGSLGLQSFWFDEAVTGYVVSRPEFGDVIDAVTQGESTPPLFWPRWLAAKAGGQGDVALRFISALTGIAVVPVA